MDTTNDPVSKPAPTPPSDNEKSKKRTMQEPADSSSKRQAVGAVVPVPKVGDSSDDDSSTDEARFEQPAAAKPTEKNRKDKASNGHGASKRHGRGDKRK